jgi:hypothetical protein
MEFSSNNFLRFLVDFCFVDHSKLISIIHNFAYLSILLLIIVCFTVMFVFKFGLQVLIVL